ncbi:disease resistance protein RPV1-like [Macadamia integrifolia]|uniref:disease resistance protein RPV1-like n=1 Tax=Macadamia integrifolia TaxID=60698 RepID=UPI001C4E99C1|nr:disease resistance protein RPV1-like [Macadamia integrifolia]
MDFGMCYNMVNLHKSIGDLKSLLKLDLSRTKIEELPDSICRLSSLQCLSLHLCTSFKKLPKSIGDLKSLVEFDLDMTKIEELPKSICGLSSLKRLILHWCSSFKELPESIGDLKSLVELDLDSTKIEELPNSISRLSSLERLSLNRCESLKKLPNGFELLEKLQVLSVMNCHNLIRLPISGGSMRCLSITDLIGTTTLLSTNDFLMLPSLVELKIGNKLESSLPPWISGLPQLQKLVLQGYTRLESVPNLPSTLTSLYVMDCISLQKLPDLSNLKKLRTLHLRNCKKLEEIQNLGGVEALEELYIDDCNTITDTPRKIHGQGALLVDGLSRSDSLNVSDGIHNGLILCLVFAFTINKETEQEMKVQEGDPAKIWVLLEASIRQKHRRTGCYINVHMPIEGVDQFTTTQDTIYIHHFKGFDLFGFPLEGVDAIEKISLTFAYFRPKNCWDSINCEVKLCKLLLGSTESFNEHQMPNQESSAKLVAVFFNWSHNEDGESSYNATEASRLALKEVERSNSVPKQGEERMSTEMIEVRYFPYTRDSLPSTEEFNEAIKRRARLTSMRILQGPLMF